MKRVDIELDRESGNYAVILQYPDGNRVEICQHCRKGEANACAEAIREFADLEDV